MSFHDELGTRMKTYYEQIPKTKLMRRTPVCIRVDGKAHHSFTRGFEKPFDNIYVKAMQQTMKYMCENIQGCVLGYTQSDEITLILVDYKTLESGAWFDYEVQKMCSVAASMATMAFNKAFEKAIDKYVEATAYFGDFDVEEKYIDRLYKSLDNGAMFDARVFNVPKEEVTNLIYWRQLDAIRNSVQMVGQANFPHKQLQGKSCNIIKQMLTEQKWIVWDELPVYLQRGSCCIKSETETTYAVEKDGEVITGAIERPHWIIDQNIPVFKGEDREYINRLVYVGE